MNNTIELSLREEAVVAAQVAKHRQAMFVMSLPVATPEQVAACVLTARDVQVSKEVLALASARNNTFRLTDEQADQVAAAREEHRRIINDPAVKKEAVEYVSKATLTSYKLRLRKADGKLTVSVTGTL